jgi:hypothetical protein
MLDVVFVIKREQGFLAMAAAPDDPASLSSRSTAGAGIRPGIQPRRLALPSGPA